jgi:hypothetical protein
MPENSNSQPAVAKWPSPTEIPAAAPITAAMAVTVFAETPVTTSARHSGCTTHMK